MSLASHNHSEKAVRAVAPMLLIACIVGLYLITLNKTLGTELIHASSTLLALAGLTCLRLNSVTKKNAMLVAVLLVFSINCLGWVYLFKQAGEFQGLYRQYLRLGKTLMMTALLVFVVSNYRIQLPGRLITGIFIVGGLGINIYAIYVGYKIHFERVQLDILAATTTAYIFTVIDIFMLHGILSLQNRWRLSALLLSFLVSYSAIILTGTRSSIIIYPFLVLAMSSMALKFRKKHLLISLLVLSTLSLATMVFFKPVIKSRIENFNNDVQLLQKNNNDTSIGIRIALARSGTNAGFTAPFGQSSEHRAEIIREYISLQPDLAPIDRFLSDHMHNEFIESFSLRGLFGICILVWLYVTLVFTSLRERVVNIKLLMLTICMMIYGISDVIFFVREGYTVYLTGIVLSIMIPHHNFRLT